MKIINLQKKLDKKTFEAIEICINIANFSNIDIFLVGGIVRDILLNKPLKDIDITVVGNAKQFVEILDCYIPLKNVKFNDNLPTAKVIFKNGIEIDFASTRKEIYDNFGELPRIIQTGCSLKEDILRRDFTINTLAISLNSNSLFQVFDFVSGLEDLKNKNLKILHKNSFYDDPSRMIRGLKFAERFDFNLDEESLILQNKYLDNPIQNIPLERVKNEIKDLFSLNKKSCFDNFIKQNLYKLFISEYKLNISGQNIKDAIFDFDINDEDIWLLYFLPLFVFENPSSKMNLSSREKKIIKEVQNFINDKPLLEDDFSIYNYFIKKDYLSVVMYSILVNSIVTKRFFKIRKVKIAITGSDLKELGFVQGKIYSKIQEDVLKEKLKNNVKSKEDEINFIKEKYGIKGEG